jgi:hypothetical protein
MIVILVILLVWMLFGALGLTLSYHNKNSPFYGHLKLNTVVIGLLCGVGCLLAELLDMASESDVVLFKREEK